MQITIGEYTTRNGCRAIVDEVSKFSDCNLLTGVVQLTGDMTQVRVWWNIHGHVRFPNGRWTNSEGGRAVFMSHELLTAFWYSSETFDAITSTPSPFDITEPKQMKEEPKPVLVQKQRLIKLPDGSWLDLKTVTAIIIFEPSPLELEGHDTWIISIHSARGEVSLKSGSLAEAKKLADELAEKVNSIK